MSDAVRIVDKIVPILKSHPEIKVDGRIEDSEMGCTCGNCHELIFKTTIGELRKNPNIFDQKQDEHRKVCKARQQ